MKELSHITMKVKQCIAEAHSFSKSLGKSESIHRDYIVNKLSDVNPTDIHIVLLDLNDKKEINYNSESGLILNK